MHSLASTGPARGRFRRVVTIHDLIYRLHPEAHAGVRTLGMRVFVPLAAHRSHRVMADSASTRDDIVHYIKVPASKVDIVPLGLGATPTMPPMDEAETRARHDLGDRQYVLSVSAKRPHKNLLRLLDALAALPAQRRPVLVVPGYPTWHERALREHAEALGVTADVRFPSWVSESELEGLYAAAACFAFPSLYEGFGMPVLEAMRRGIPVACSNCSSLPEVAGDAALMFDPERPAEIAAAIERLLTDRAEAERLRVAGRERAARFSWKATARATLRTYERVLSAGEL
jgi:glycosyltransferase involved in cell wall biosynthesis